MGDPNYVYTPWSKERRQRVQAALLRNHGTPKGHHKLWGVNVPDKLVKQVSAIVSVARSRTDDMEALELLIKVLIRVQPLLEEEARDKLLLALALTKLPRRRKPRD